MKKAIICLFVLFSLLAVSPTQQHSFVQASSSSTQLNDCLSQEDAKQLLLNYNNSVNYIFQGTSENFQALKDKNLQGYVFLPDVPTDIGYFVDQNSKQIYFFHPSGYLELVK